MQLIQTVTVGSGGAASITFGSGGTIPQTYTDLYLVLSLRTTNTVGVSPKFNGSTANFSGRFLGGSGSSAFSYTATNLIAFATRNDAWTANTFGNCGLYIPNYTAATAKSMSLDSVTENNATSVELEIGAILWNSTSPITSIELLPDNSTSFTQYSSASLYGITAGSDGIVTVS